MIKLTLSICALAAMPGSALFAQNITGTWQGALQGPQGPALRIVMKISLEDDKLKAVSYSIDQNPTPVQASAITRDGSTLKTAFASLGGSWEGKISADGNSLTGTWTQGGPAAPLNFTRATPETAWTIPDPPPPPKIMAADVNPAFEVATIKPGVPGSPGKGLRVGPNGMMTTLNYSLSDLIQFTTMRIRLVMYVTSFAYWWELRPCDYYKFFDAPKIIFPDISKAPRFYLDASGFYLANTAYCLGTDDKYLLGVLNSRLFWFAISNISIPFGVRAGEYRYRLIYQYMEKVPIRPINFSDPADKARHDKMVELVDRMLELNKQKHSGKLAPSQVDRVDREIAATDAEIDNLVYELYGITDEERKVIERM